MRPRNHQQWNVANSSPRLIKYPIFENWFSFLSYLVIFDVYILHATFIKVYIWFQSLLSLIIIIWLHLPLWARLSFTQVNAPLLAICWIFGSKGEKAIPPQKSTLLLSIMTEGLFNSWVNWRFMSKIKLRQFRG